jgi:phospho-N-acetylmuramoyl-pentapeptide-transferase
MNPVQQVFDFLPYGNTLSKMLIYFIGTTIWAFLLSPVIIDILYKLNVKRKGRDDQTMKMDVEKGKIGTPIMGGLIVIITTTVITFLFNWERNYTWLPIGAFILSACIGAIDDLLNIFGGIRKQPKPFKMHVKLAFVHKSYLQRLYYFVTIPWAALIRFFKMLGSISKTGLLPHEKIIMQMFIGLTVGLWVYNKLGWDDIWVPYILNVEPIQWLINAIPGFTVNLAANSITVGWLMVPFIMLTIMTLSNAVNITDGMDGLAGGLLISSFIGYAIIAFGFAQLPGNEGYRSIAYLCCTLVGALFAYLYFNVKPARVQMSDVGSLALGTILSVIAIILHREFTLLLIAGMFLIDGIITPLIQIFSVKLRGKKVFPMTPIHYSFEMRGWAEEKVVVRFWIVGAFLTAIGVWLALI